MTGQETTIEKLMQIIGEQTVQIRLMNDEMQRLRAINEKNNSGGVGCDDPSSPDYGVQPV
jgi:uncharacterized coiled-coil protein SlyX